MGVKNLWDIIESCKKTHPLHHLQNKRVCVDLSCWMIQLQNAGKSHSSIKDKVYLKNLFHRLRALIALNCSLIFVTDGSIPAVKVSTYRRRLNSGFEVSRDEMISNKVSSLRRNTGSEFSCMIKEAKALGETLGIPCLDGIEEAEAQCALLDSEGLCDGCFSSDSDVFLFGARTVYRDICLGEGGYVTCYEMADIEKKLGFGKNSLIALALLLGSDYSRGVHGVGRESACQIVKSIGDEFVLQQIVSEGLSFSKKSKGSGSEHNLKRGDRLLEVINAYLKPICHSADSSAVHRVLALRPFQRTKLQEICARSFGWTPDITDEYILPKIAERHLRRFANLCSTSSELHKKAVQCPVARIIKKRTVRGTDCFEVSWEDLAGFKSSIVPADLIASACPEKIAEYNESRTKEKKRNPCKPRLNQSENQASLAEINLKLQGLLLNIDSGSGSSSFCNTFAMRASISDNSSAISRVDLANKERLPVMDSENYIDYSEKNHCFNTSSVAEKVVIDLLSPPAVHTGNVSKCQQPNLQPIDVIDLSDSETEASPEHQKKARELRLFIASIRDGIH
ncbi:single-strand DNA endonuclease 1 isoform X2 [Malania oleifera]|uniref:single-strand DNA endonuclease 1 isoform X2 n=1 Tax=Malania oleifera TaxID=397392 RepID=UPI0025AE6067|nr:single-strand DNA endonuclease 1 isoform X2 [Malania oleifera]